MDKDKWISYDIAIAALYQLEEYRSAEWGAKRFTTDDIENMLEEIAEIDVAPVRHGKWHDVYMTSPSSFAATCSVCGVSNDIPHPINAYYCPNCGARMDGK